MAHLSKQGKNYFVWFKYNGKLIKRSCKTDNRHKAGLIKAELEYRLGKGMSPFESTQPNNDLKITDYLAECEKFSQVNKSLNTFKRDKNVFNNFKKFCGNINISKIDKAFIEKYKHYLLTKKHFANSGINIELRHLSSAFNLAVNNKYLQENPFKGIKKLPVPKKKPIFLTKDQAKQLLNVTRGKPIYHYIFIALNSGCRISEIASLKWTNVDFENRSIKVVGKGDKERHIPLTCELMNYLKSLSRTSPFVAPGTKDIHKTTGRFRKEADLLGLHDFTFHSLRHTYASWLVQNGVPLKVIQEILGHANISTTLIYAHLDPRSKEQASKVIDSILS